MLKSLVVHIFVLLWYSIFHIGNEMPQDFRSDKLSVHERARGISRIIIG